MNVFISGGAKNGKSMFAQRAAKEMAEEKGARLYYVATVRPEGGKRDGGREGSAAVLRCDHDSP